MARIQDDFSGGGQHSSTASNALHIDANGKTTIPLPDANFVTNSDILRDGSDLVLRTEDGREAVIHDYFTADPVPVLLGGENGIALTPQLVDSFVHPIDGLQFAQKGSMDDASPVGVIKEATGESTITRADGSSEKISVGTPVHEGDVIETNGDGAVSITFVDETTFSVSNNAKLAIDEYVFDPASQSGETGFSVLRGIFSFTSGLIGREDPDDVTIDTPVGSIGIRGTTIMGHISPDGESQITVVEGAIVVRNGAGEQTLSEQFETVRITGFESAMTYQGVLSTQEIGESYNVLRSVAAPLFSTIDETGGQPTSEPQDSAPADSETAPEQRGDITPQQVAPDTITAQTADNTPKPVEATTTPVIAADAVTVSVLATPVLLDAGFDTGLSRGALINLSPAAAMPHSAPSAALAHATTPAHSAAAPTPAPVTAEPVTTTPPITVTPPVTTTPPPVTQTADVNLTSLLQSLPNGGSLDGIKYLTANTAGMGMGTTVVGLGASGAGGTEQYAYISNSGYMVIAGQSGTANQFSVTTPFGFTAGSEIVLSRAGDFNGDGILDHMIGSGQSGATTGVVHIITNLASLTRFQVAGFSGASEAGTSLDLIGDFNGDGFSDLIVGAPEGSSAGDAGKAYIIFGNSSGLVDIGSGFDNGATAPYGSEGFYLSGSVADGKTGYNVTGLQDFNGDGFSDFAFSTPGFNTASNQGRVEIVYGKNTDSAVTAGSRLIITGIDVDPTDRDIPLISLGDSNGDGRTDLAIAELGTNTLHIFHGRASGLTGTVNIDTSDVKITSTNEIIGGGAAGDFNGDGKDDIALALRNGSNVDIYIIYGGSLSGVIDPATLADTAKFHMTMDLSSPQFNLANPATDDITINIAGAGDINNDGFSDLLIGIKAIDNPNLSGYANDGGVLLVHGRAEQSDITSGKITTANNATMNGQTVLGTGSADVMNSGSYTDLVFKSGGGNDTINVKNTASFDLIDGGTGIDTLQFINDGNIDLTNVGALVRNIEHIKLTGASQNLIIGLDDIFRLLQESANNSLTLSGNGSSAITIDGPVPAGSLADLGFSAGTPSGSMDVWHYGGYTLNIDQANVAIV